MFHIRSVSLVKSLKRELLGGSVRKFTKIVFFTTDEA